MEIKFLTEPDKYYDQLMAMLIEADDDFVPPLSARYSNKQDDLTSFEKTSDGFKKYLEGMLHGKLIAAVENGKICGFVSYTEDLLFKHIDESKLPNIYINTLIVSKDCRGRGITKLMYDELFETYKHANIYTRTWSTNNAHIKILGKYGFGTLAVLKDDRGPGIDTVYFEKKAK